MTKAEFNDLFDSLCYGHDADLTIDGQRYFLEWADVGLIIYKMRGETGNIIDVLKGEIKNQIVDKLFDYEFSPRKSLNYSYQDCTILDIE